MAISNKRRLEIIWVTSLIVVLLVVVSVIKVVFYPTTSLFKNPTVVHNPITDTSSTTVSEVISEEPPLSDTEDPDVDDLPGVLFIEVIDGCGIHFGGDCLLVRSGPGTEFPEVAKLRNNQVLRVADTITKDGITWYKVIFDEWLLFPERVKDDWYVSADFVKPFKDTGNITTWENSYATGTKKKIIVDRTEQKLRAYDDDKLYMEVDVSTGLRSTPTPSGTFDVFKKMPSRYMQGPLPGVPGNQYYDLPGVPWNLYFTQGGAVIHGAYWHDSFGSRYSHGCVNLWPQDAKKLYDWTDLGTIVDIQN